MSEILEDSVFLAVGGLLNLILVLSLKHTWRYWTQVSRSSYNSLLDMLSHTYTILNQHHKAIKFTQTHTRLKSNWTKQVRTCG